MTKRVQPPTDSNKNVLRLREADYTGKCMDRIDAETAQSPIHANVQTTRHYSRGTFGVSDVTHSVDVLAEKVAKIQAGDMSAPEAILFAQATALDAIFTELARRAAIYMNEHIGTTDAYLRLALKAQSQCRSTLEALAEIKMPCQVAFVKQANFANGPQQVNNTEPRVRKVANRTNELSGAGHELRQNTRTSKAASRVDSSMETVGAVYGAALRAREG